MFNKKITIISLIISSLIIFFGGCTKHYEVRDIESGQIYYTRDVDYKHGGAVQFRDDRTDRKTVLQSSEVKRIDKDKYDVHVYPGCD